MSRVLIRGDGLAARCCAQLLGGYGFEVSLERTAVPRLPALLVEETTRELLDYVFGRRRWPRSIPRVRRRMVVWGREAKPVCVAHPALVLSESALLELVLPDRDLPPSRQSDHWPWMILAAKQAASGAPCFGSHRAWFASVKLTPRLDDETCWIESVRNGWLFLIPEFGGNGWLLSIGNAADVLLRYSRYIVDFVNEVNPIYGPTPAYPRITFPSYGTGWMVCGSAAMALDPVSGDGTGNAIRGAILASAVTRALAKNSGGRSPLQHYQLRLLRAFDRHLHACAGFYAAGAAGPWWHRELRFLRNGLTWTQEKLLNTPRLGYRVVDFELVPINQSAAEEPDEILPA